MAETYGPYSSGAGDNLTDAQWQAMFTGVFPDGVIKNGAGTDCAVTAPNSNMTVVVAIGNAILRGVGYQNGAAKTITISAADPTNPRIDLVVLHADLSGKTIAAQVTTGTPAGSPSVPALTQTSTVWEIPLAQVAVAAGATSLSNSNVTDVRQYGGLYGAILPAAAAGARVFVQSGTPSGANKYDLWVKLPFS